LSYLVSITVNFYFLIHSALTSFLVGAFFSVVAVVRFIPLL
jgi:hypothetical protein